MKFFKSKVTQTTTTTPVKDVSQAEMETVKTLLERYALLSARISAVELDLENMRNKILRKTQDKTPTNTFQRFQP